MIGQIGFFTEVELGLRDKKVGRLGGMKNWYYFCSCTCLCFSLFHVFNKCIGEIPLQFP